MSALKPIPGPDEVCRRGYVRAFDAEEAIGQAAYQVMGTPESALGPDHWKVYEVRVSASLHKQEDDSDEPAA